MWCAPSVKIRPKGASTSTPFCARHYAGVQIESFWAKCAAKERGPCWILSTQGTPDPWQRFMPALRYKRATQYQEHEVIFDLPDKRKQAPIYRQLFAPPESSVKAPFLE